LKTIEIQPGVTKMTKCDKCGKEKPTNKQCEYCHKTFCEEHMPEHQAWEHRHETLAEDESRLWKKRERP
jgi:predicted nucleic acid binding AN1-type Zn finger protein